MDFQGFFLYGEPVFDCWSYMYQSIARSEPIQPPNTFPMFSMPPGNMYYPNYPTSNGTCHSNVAINYVEPSVIRHQHKEGCVEQELSGDGRQSTNRFHDNTMMASYEEKKKQFTCQVCGKIYSRISTLKIHFRTHTGEKPFQCKICFKAFSQDANLKAHQRIHSGQKPFQCSVCDKRFAQPSSLTLHTRIHSGERPYKCTHCPRGFACSSTLTKHLRIHTGEKPYQCKICDMRFSQSGNLSRHMQIHKR